MFEHKIVAEAQPSFSAGGADPVAEVDPSGKSPSGFRRPHFIYVFAMQLLTIAVPVI